MASYKYFLFFLMVLIILGVIFFFAGEKEVYRVIEKEQPVVEEVVEEGYPIEEEITFYKGVYIIAMAQPDLLQSIREAKEIRANSVNLLADFGLGEEGKIEFYEWDKRKMVEGINLAHELGMVVQLSGGFVITEEYIPDYYNNFEDYKNDYVSVVGELARMAKKYKVERFEVLREIDVVTSILADYEGWEGWWVAWNKTKYIEVMEDFGQELLSEARKYYQGKIGMGFSKPETKVNLSGYEFIGVTIYAEPLNFTKEALKNIEEARNYVGEFNGIEELVIGETALGEEPKEAEKRKEIYNEFFEETWEKVDGYFVFIFEPYPDEELKEMAKDWYGRIV